MNLLVSMMRQRQRILVSMLRLRLNANDLLTNQRHSMENNHHFLQESTDDSYNILTENFRDSKGNFERCREDVKTEMSKSC